jgi:hypothetical protein
VVDSASVCVEEPVVDRLLQLTPGWPPFPFVQSSQSVGPPSGTIDMQV